MILSRRMAALRAEASKPPAVSAPVEATVPDPDAVSAPVEATVGASSSTSDDRPPRRPTHRR